LKSPRTDAVGRISSLFRDHLPRRLRQWFGHTLPKPESPVRTSLSTAAFAAPPVTVTKKRKGREPRQLAGQELAGSAGVAVLRFSPVPQEIVNGTKSISVRSTKMNFILTGFTEDTGFRVFAFQGIGANGTRLDYTVKANLGLSRVYGIRLQELPLLCRGVLDRLPDGAEARTVTFTEEGMRLHADSRAAERDAAKKRRVPPRPPTEQPATGWRAAQP
jgi:hypothetical protein